MTVTVLMENKKKRKYMKIRPINRNNPKNIYCGHCEYFKSCNEYLSKCANEKSEHYQNIRCYYNRCKNFEWRKDASYVETGAMKVKNRSVKTYKKKPVIIEAMQFTRDSWEELIEFTNGKATSFNKSLILEDAYICNIQTLEGLMTATEGDFIIRGVKGEFYPCKPDIFEQTYDEVADAK
jgi:hypothetical protein